MLITPRRWLSDPNRPPIRWGNRPVVSLEILTGPGTECRLHLSPVRTDSAGHTVINVRLDDFCLEVGDRGFMLTFRVRQTGAEGIELEVLAGGQSIGRGIIDWQTANSLRALAEHADSNLPWAGIEWLP